MKAEKVIIIGAPRSGTNMLRDLLCSVDGIATWPCDEINYIWRHGNLGYPSDEFVPEMVTPAIQSYLQKQFDWVAEHYQAKKVVEKTCANSLRVGFVDRAVQEVRYIFIFRDGIDATGSARLRWTAGLDFSYLMQKARFVPATDLPYYAGRYLWSRLYRLVSRDKRVAFWGPVLQGMDEILRNHSLNEVCALQWQRCVESADAALSMMPESRVFRLKYEDFVSRPVEEFQRLLGFLDADASEQQVREIVSGVSSKSIGKGRDSLTDEEVKKLESLVGETLERFGYL